jgi:predicted DNA-binding protein with PD1-like motif
MRITLIAAVLIAGAAMGAAGVVLAQDALPPNYAVSPPDHGDGHAPGMKATELGPRVRTFHITFQKGDDPAAGLKEFARKNNLTNAHFEAIGAFGSAVIGWSDRPMKAFKVVRINEEMEVAAFNGNIVRGKDGEPVVHAHCAVGILSNEKVYVGHCLQEEVSLTLQVYVTDNGPLKAAAK